jgi:hypothetical protein
MEEKRTIYTKDFHLPVFLFKFMGIPHGPRGRKGGRQLARLDVARLKVWL